MILKEGGNIFKDEKGVPVTQRIARDDVDPTLDWVEKITGIPHKDMKLGSTGIKSSSGDIDVAINQDEVNKEELYQKLVAWAEKNHPDDPPRAWVAKSGTNVHFKTPINGNPANGFVQTDLMFGNPQWMKFALRGMGDDTPYKGAHRMIFLASIAKAQGYQWSPTKGLVNRDTKEQVSINPDEIAKLLIGKTASRSDLDSVESINKALKGRSDYENLVADVRANFEKQGLPMPESRSMHTGLMLAERNIFQKAIGGVAKGIGNTARTAYAGFKAGQASPKGIGATRKAYKQAGGGKTTVGQIGSLAKKAGHKLTGTEPAKISKPSVQGGSSQGTHVKMKKGWSTKVIPAKDFQKFSDKGWKQVTKESINEGARIQHVEDLVFFEGSKGAIRALQSLRKMGQGGHKDVTLKWDGSPAIIFGRNEDGEFILTDKSGFVAKGYDGRSKSPDDLENMLLNRSGGKNKDKPDYVQFANNMKQVYNDYEKAVPQDYRGYFKGDLLYFDTPQVVEQNYVFKPNIVEYAVDINSDLGKKIGKSKTGVVIHRQVDADGNESPLQDPDIFIGNRVLVVPPVSVEQAPEPDLPELDRLAQIIKKDSSAIDSLLNPDTLRAMKVTDFPDILYTYTNSKVDTGLENLGRDFVKWLGASKVSRIKQQKIIEYIKQNMQAFTSLWEVVNGIMKVKNGIINQLDSNGGSVKARTAGQEGGEGYVLAHPGGDVKLVNRAGFSAANRAVQR